MERADNLFSFSGTSKLLVKIITSLCLLFLAFPTLIEAAEPVMRIGILSNQYNLSITSDVSFGIFNEGTEEKIAQFPAKEKVNITFKAKGIVVNGKPFETEDILIKKEVPEENSYVEVNKRKYRGFIRVSNSIGQKGLTVINVLPIEQYLYGVIAKEISPDWPIEAVKAQAVAARSYALANRNKHQKEGYDLCATTDCQVYWGKNSEADGAIKAVKATYGQVLMYQGNIIPAYFHSSSGGYTENSENVWNEKYPYLKGVIDFDQNSPHFKWEKKFTSNELSEILSKAGYDIGVLKAIEVSPLSAPPVFAADRGISGRVKSIRFTGKLKSAEIEGGEKLRRIFDLHSSLFDIQIVTPLPPSLDMTITDRVGNQETKNLEINVPPVQNKEFLKERNFSKHLTGRNDEIIVFSGFGWGHGLGLSQWGAKAMAEQAKPGDTTYFKEILKHYYQGVSVQKVY